jgi:hypothetical protein
MAKVDGEDGQYHQPRLDTLAEKLDPHQLAGSGIDGGTHQKGLEEAQAVVDRDRSEQGTEGRRGQGNDNAAPQAFSEITAVHGDSFFPLP